MENKKSRLVKPESGLKGFNIGKSENHGELIKTYNHFIKEFFLNTFVDEKRVRPDAKVWLGGDADYIWIDEIPYNQLKKIVPLVEDVRQETGENEIMPTFFLSTPYGGKYDEPFAKTAKAMMTEANGFDTWNEIWMGADLAGKDGNANFNYGDTMKKNASQFSIIKASAKDAKDFAMVYDQSINGAGSVYESDIETLKYAQKILNIDTKAMDVVTFLAKDNASGKTAGFLLGGCDGEHSYINDIGVAPEFRKMGVCSLLVREFNTYAKKLGARDVFLDTMDQHPTNVPIYSKLGFAEKFLTVQGYNDELAKKVLAKCGYVDLLDQKLAAEKAADSAELEK